MKLAPCLIAILPLWGSLATAAPPARRSMVEAMPPGTVEALFLEPLERMEPAMDGLSAALGGGFALDFAEAAPLPNLALQGLARGDPGALGLDPAGGLGLFRVDGYAGLVGVVAISDERRAMGALVRTLRADGAELLGGDRAGMELQVPAQGLVMAFVHGGFLYLAMPEDGLDRQANRDLAALVRAAPPAGLGGTEPWKRVSSRLDRARRGGALPAAAAAAGLRHPRAGAGRSPGSGPPPGGRIRGDGAATGPRSPAGAAEPAPERPRQPGGGALLAPGTPGRPGAAAGWCDGAELAGPRGGGRPAGGQRGRRPGRARIHARVGGAGRGTGLGLGERGALGGVAPGCRRGGGGAPGTAAACGAATRPPGGSGSAKAR